MNKLNATSVRSLTAKLRDTATKLNRVELRFSITDCPLAVKRNPSEHYNASQYLTGSKIEWACPLCGHKFSL